MPFSVTTSSEIDAVPWDRYVDRTAGASLYHLSGWNQVIRDTFAHDVFYLTAQDNSIGIAGILPLTQLKSWMFGDLLVSVPYFNYGGICADNPAARAALLEGAVALARRLGVDSIELRHDADWPHDLPRKTAKVSMKLDLPASADDLWSSFSTKLRTRVRRTSKEGLTTSIGRDEQLAAFYGVFSTNMRDLGTPVYPKSFFARILERFPERTWIVTVDLKGVPVASGFLIAFKDRIEIPWASSIRTFNRLAPNMLLYWTCLEFACRQGYRVFDFGRSTPGEGTYVFKEQWGARPHQLYWDYWLPEGGQLPQINPKNPKYQAAIAMWQRLPLPLTRALGPRVVKYIP